MSLRGIRGIRYVEPLVVRHLAYTPTDPLVPKQWYLPYSGFYAPWVTLPSFESIPVAVIDSGVDAGHPDLAGKILDEKSFVGGSARVDTFGHGTFVAGLIGAGHDNGIGIAGLVPSAELLIARVVTKSRTIPVDAEARAIRWAVDHGARVINMSLGGVRDPLDPERDTYSRLEADAVAYAVSNGVVVVAAVGNSDQAPVSPWKYASYPAALPHVLGVSAMNDTGGIPSFSNRDLIFNDLAAPGLEILSILPRPLTARFPQCTEQGYSSCGPEEYREAQGTSFAAPQVAAAAAVLLSLKPTLQPEQVTRILQSTATDLDAANGCDACAEGRDAYSGWGRLNVAAAIEALAGPAAAARLPTRRTTTWACARTPCPAPTGDSERGSTSGTTRTTCTRSGSNRNQPVYVGLTGSDTSVDLSLAFWLPRARSLERVADFRYRVRTSARSGSRQYLSYRPRLAGTYYVQVRMSSPGATRYRLAIVKG